MPLTSRIRVPVVTNANFTITEGGIIINNTDETNHPIFLQNEATVWDDLTVPVNATKLGGSKDPTYAKFKDNGAASQGVFAYSFPDPGVETELYFTAQLSHKYKEGTDIYAHVHWSPSSAGAGNVAWGLEYTWTNINEVFPDTSITITPIAADGVANKQQLGSIVTIDGTGKKISSMLDCRIFRSATGDTYSDGAWLHEIDFHFQVDTIGSRQLVIK